MRLPAAVVSPRGAGRKAAPRDSGRMTPGATRKTAEAGATLLQRAARSQSGYRVDYGSHSMWVDPL